MALLPNRERPVVVVYVPAARGSVARGAPGLLTGHMTELPLVRAARIPRTDAYHGVEVTEEYRWLEDASSEETIAWTKAQYQRTCAYFGGIAWRDALRARVGQLLKAERATYKRLLSGGSTFFALKMQTPRQQPFLVALTDLDDLATERVVVDPDAIDPSGETAIDFFVPSPDGRRVAVSLSEHGTEDGSLYVYDAGSGTVVDEPIPHVNLMGGSAAWRHDGSGFWYTRCAGPRGLPATGVVPRARRYTGPRGPRGRLRRRADRGELSVRFARRPLGDGPGADG
jgi:protease II